MGVTQKGTALNATQNLLSAVWGCQRCTVPSTLLDALLQTLVLSNADLSN